jgi:hypothetical protein
MEQAFFQQAGREQAVLYKPPSPLRAARERNVKMQLTEDAISQTGNREDGEEKRRWRFQVEDRQLDLGAFILCTRFAPCLYTCLRIRRAPLKYV